jgi:hypothetical protein
MTLAPSHFHNETADRIADLLDGLGDTADAIAERLAEAGITGQRTEAASCPIAHYLRHAEPRISHVDVFGTVIEVDTSDGDSVILATPDAVHEFVSLFDTKRYPYLLNRWEMTR